MFSRITINWRGQLLTSHEVIIRLIVKTTTQQGLSIQAALDTNRYPLGIVVTDQELAGVNLKRAEFHGDWNYTIESRSFLRWPGTPFARIFRTLA